MTIFEETKRNGYYKGESKKKGLLSDDIHKE